MVKAVLITKSSPLVYGPGCLCTLFYFYSTFIFVMTEDRSVPGFTKFLCASWNSVFEVQIKQDNDALKKLPVWIGKGLKNRNHHHDL